MSDSSPQLPDEFTVVCLTTGSIIYVGQSSEEVLKFIQENDTLSFIELEALTGETHYIRVRNIERVFLSTRAARDLSDEFNHARQLERAAFTHIKLQERAEKQMAEMKDAPTITGGLVGPSGSPLPEA